MLKLAKLLAISSLIAISSTSFAELGYDAKLQQLQAKTDVGFGVSIPFPQKVTAVNKLYDLVFNSNVQDYFEKIGLVQRIVLMQPIGIAPGSLEAQNQASLRQHTLLLNVDGSDNDFVITNLPVFVSELKEIAQAEAELKALYPTLKLERESSLYNGTTAANRSYLQHLNLLKVVLSDRSYEASLRKFGVLWILDSADDFKKTGCVQFFQQGLENGHLVTKKGLQIQLSYDGLYQQQSYVSEPTLRQFVKTIAVNDFAAIGFSILDSDQQVNAVMAEFNLFFTPERIAKIKAKGIKRLYFTYRIERESDWIQGDTLLLGLTLTEMELVYNTLFAD